MFFQVTDSVLKANYMDCHGSRITSKTASTTMHPYIWTMNFYGIKETFHNLHRKHEQNITYSMLDIQLLQQGGVSSLRKMTLFIYERQQPQFLEEQGEAEDELVHRWTQMLRPVWKNHKVLEVVVCREVQNHLYMTKTPLSQRTAILFFWQCSFWNIQCMIHGQNKEKEATGRSNSSADVGSF